MTKLNTIVIIGIIAAFLFFAPQAPIDDTQAIINIVGGEAGDTCFDFIDNDGDGARDLRDEDCFRLASLDPDGDGFSNAEEWEFGTDRNDPNDFPDLGDFPNG